MLELSLLQNKYTVDLKTSYKSMSVKRFSHAAVLHLMGRNL